MSVVAIVVVVGTATACSGGDDTSADGGDTGGAAVPETATLSIADLAFEPSTLPIAAGSTDITITNADTTNHTFTLDDGSVDQAVDAGETVTVTVEGDSGTSMPFHCEIHSAMTGTLQVA
ncbi:MAG TPA: cupredoxin domain-containing protein [Actinomycetota bacterium]